MRVCFDGFCFASRRSAVVEEGTQTVLCGATALDTLNITTFFNKSSNTIDNQLPSQQQLQHQQEQRRQQKSTSSNYLLRFSSTKKAPSASEKFKMIEQEDLNFTNNNSLNTNNSANNSTMFSHTNDNNNSKNMLATQTGNEFDTENNNHLRSTSSQADLVRNDLLNHTVDSMNNIYINDGADFNMQDEMEQLTSKEKDLIKIIQIKDLKIKELIDRVQMKDDMIANLRSHLDKFQSVFPFRSGAMGARKINRTAGGQVQRQRAQGISAEPQSESAVLELMNITFPKYEKEER